MDYRYYKILLLTTYYLYLIIRKLFVQGCRLVKEQLKRI